MSSGYRVPMPTAPAGPADHGTDETSARIIETAARIIATEPFEALSMRRIATDAGVSLSTVVRHFGTKDALLAALVAASESDEDRGRRQRVRPGDIPAAVTAVTADYEEHGESFLNVLGQEHRFPALSRLLQVGRQGHREWVRWAFEPQLRRRRGARRQRLEDLLVVTTDVYTWKLLRIDQAMSAGDTRASMTELTEAVAAR